MEKVPSSIKPYIDRPINWFRNRHISKQSKSPAEVPNLLYFETESDNLSEMIYADTILPQRRNIGVNANEPQTTIITKYKGVPSSTLSLQGYAVCFFPEQPKREKVVEKVTNVVLQARKRERNPLALLPDQEKAVLLHLSRERWTNRLIYLMALTCFSFSFTNLCQFPLLVYKYGKAYLVCYTILSIVMGYPLHVLEASMGQFAQCSIFKIWLCLPPFLGVGISFFLSCILTTIYQNMFAAYSLIYVAHSFNVVLPWINTTQVYFFQKVLDISSHDELTMEPIRWWLVPALFFSWYLVYIGTFRNLHSLGNISIIFVLLPYFLLLILLLRLLFSENHLFKGIQFALDDRNSANFLSLELWRVASFQIMLELGLCHGTPLVFASFCHFNHVVHVDSLILCLINYVNSLLCLCLFSFMGAPPLQVRNNGLNILFDVYSERLSLLEGAQFWCSVAFLMVFFAVIGSQIAVLTTLTSVIYDFNQGMLLRYRWIINLIICFCLFGVSLICCTGNGFHYVTLIHVASLCYTVLPLGFTFAFVILVVYSLGKYCKSMQIILGEFQMSFVARLCSYIFLIFLGLITVGSLCLYGSNMFLGRDVLNKNIAAGWTICGLVLVPILIGFLTFAAYFALTCRNDMRDVLNAWIESRKLLANRNGGYSRRLLWQWK